MIRGIRFDANKMMTILLNITYIRVYGTFASIELGVMRPRLTAKAANRSGCISSINRQAAESRYFGKQRRLVPGSPDRHHLS